jgi:hypothetical protein
MKSHTITNLKRISREIETIKDNVDPASDEALADMIVNIERITDQAIKHVNGKDPSDEQK